MTIEWDFDDRWSSRMATDIPEDVRLGEGLPDVEPLPSLEPEVEEPPST